MVLANVHATALRSGWGVAGPYQGNRGGRPYFKVSGNSLTDASHLAAAEFTTYGKETAIDPR